MNTQDLINSVLTAGGFIAVSGGGGKRDAYKARQNIKRTARRMGVADRVMVWAERGQVYIAKRVQA